MKTALLDCLAFTFRCGAPGHPIYLWCSFSGKTKGSVVYPNGGRGRQ